MKSRISYKDYKVGDTVKMISKESDPEITAYAGEWWLNFTLNQEYLCAYPLMSINALVVIGDNGMPTYVDTGCFDNITRPNIEML